MTQVAYITRDPATVAAIRQVIETRNTFNRALTADLAALGRNTGAVGWEGFGRPEITGLKPLDPADPPAGWRFLKGRGYLQPRAGKAGDGARQWLADHQPPRGPIDAIGDNGAPTNVTLPGGNGSVRICPPALLVTDDAVHLMYEATPVDHEDRAGRSFSHGPDVPDSRWEKEPLSAWHLALEAERARLAQEAEARS